MLRLRKGVRRIHTAKILVILQSQSCAWHTHCCCFEMVEKTNRLKTSWGSEAPPWPQCGAKSGIRFWNTHSAGYSQICHQKQCPRKYSNTVLYTSFSSCSSTDSLKMDHAEKLCLCAAKRQNLDWKNASKLGWKLWQTQLAISFLSTLSLPVFLSKNLTFRIQIY